MVDTCSYKPRHLVSFPSSTESSKTILLSSAGSSLPYKRHFHCAIRILMLPLCAPMLELFLMSYCEHCLLVFPFLSSLFWEPFAIDLCPGAVITLASTVRKWPKLLCVRIRWSHSCHLTQHRSICKLVSTTSTSAAPPITCLQCKYLSSSAAASSVTDHNIDLCGGEMTELRVASLEALSLTFRINLTTEDWTVLFLHIEMAIKTTFQIFCYRGAINSPNWCVSGSALF